MKTQPNPKGLKDQTTSQTLEQGKEPTFDVLDSMRFCFAANLSSGARSAKSKCISLKECMRDKNGRKQPHGIASMKRVTPQNAQCLETHLKFQTTLSETAS
eukprot:4344842-Amphidinium_carterae.1